MPPRRRRRPTTSATVPASAPPRDVERQRAALYPAWASSPVDPIVAARKARPAAVSATPIHSRRVTGWPNNRSASTVSSTSPPAITDCTSEIGARLRRRDVQPPGRHRHDHPDRVPGGAEQRERRADGPRPLHRRGVDRAAVLERKPRIDANAVASAKSRPSWTDKGIVLIKAKARPTAVTPTPPVGFGDDDVLNQGRVRRPRDGRAGAAQRGDGPDPARRDRRARRAAARLPRAPRGAPAQGRPGRLAGAARAAATCSPARPTEITMAEVVEALEGSIAPIECITEAADGSIVCSRESDPDHVCPTKLLWTRVRFSIVARCRRRRSPTSSRPGAADRRRDRRCRAADRAPLTTGAERRTWPT